jgi:hypothetical protein
MPIYAQSDLVTWIWIARGGGESVDIHACMHACVEKSLYLNGHDVSIEQKTS